MSGSNMGGDAVTLRVVGKAANELRRARFSTGQWVEVTCRDASSGNNSGSRSGGIEGSREDGGYASPGSPSTSDNGGNSGSGSSMSGSGMTGSGCTEVTDIDSTRRRSSNAGSGTIQ